MKATTFLKNFNLLRIYQAGLIYVPYKSYKVITEAYDAAQKGS